MRVGFAIPSLDGGGAEYVTRQWAGALTEKGHETYAYTFNPGGSSKLNTTGGVHRHFPMRSTIARWLVFPFWLRRQAQRDSLDALVTMLTFTNLVGIVGLRLVISSSVPLVIVQHNVLTLEMQPLSQFDKRLKRWLAHRLYRRADAVIGVSHSVVANLLGACAVDSAKAFVVPNPVTRTPSHALSPPQETLNIGFVGRLVPQKRPFLYIDALAALSEWGVKVRGTILGNGPLLRETVLRAESRGVDLSLRGWQEPWWDSATDVDCLLLPSVFEGLGNVYVEAAAAGIPSVACSSALGTADAVIPGLTGELVSGSEPEQLADGVLRATASRGVNPLHGWLSRFSVETSTAILLDVLNRVGPELR